jgi:hypothetical protein
VSDNQEQEMEFADPAWQPRVTQEFKVEQDTFSASPPRTPTPGVGLPPTQQSTTQQQASDEDTREYAEGYRAQSTQTPGNNGTFQGQQQQPPYQQSYRPPRARPLNLPGWAWVLIIIVLFSGGGPFFTSHSAAGHLISGLFTVAVVVVLWLVFSRRMTVNLTGGGQRTVETRTFAVAARPTISIRNRAGSIRLHAGKEGQVTMNTTRRGFLFFTQWQHMNNQAQVAYSQDSGKNTLSARVSNWKLIGQNAVDFDITVPPNSNLDITTNAGSIFVQGITGQMILQSDAGSINASQVQLQGRSRYKTEAGVIKLSGAIDPQGDYALATDLGTISVTLPPDASFNLDAKTDLGTVSTNFLFPQSQKTKAKGPSGPGPVYPRLRLKTDVGTISINH